MSAAEPIVWAAPDGSYGSCELEDLLIIPVSAVPDLFDLDLTEQEVYAAVLKIRDDMMEAQ